MHKNEFNLIYIKNMINLLFIDENICLFLLKHKRFPIHRWVKTAKVWLFTRQVANTLKLKKSTPSFRDSDASYLRTLVKPNEGILKIFPISAQRKLMSAT